MDAYWCLQDTYSVFTTFYNYINSIAGGGGASPGVLSLPTLSGYCTGDGSGG